MAWWNLKQYLPGRQAPERGSDINPVLHTQLVYGEGGGGRAETLKVPPYLEAWLALLTTGLAPEGTLSPLELDGFCTGLAVAPEIIPQDAWIPALWGSPAPADSAEVRAAIAAAVAHSIAIDGELAAALKEIDAGLKPRTISPMYLQVSKRRQQGCAAIWTGGFVRAVELCGVAWRELLANDLYVHITHPFMVFCVGPNGEAFYPDVTARELEMLRNEAVVMIPQALTGLRMIAQNLRTDHEAGKVTSDPVPEVNPAAGPV